MHSLYLRRLLLLIALFTQFDALAQTITITESTLKIGSISEETFYYGFDKGDEVIFSFESEKELKEIQIFEYVSASSLFMDYKTVLIDKKSIRIANTGVYGFRFINGSLTGRVCKFKIDRVPKEGGNPSFNSTVLWKEISDTTYTMVQESYLVSSDTSIIHVVDQWAKVSSTNALNGNTNKNLVDFMLPNNTVSWSYYIGVGTPGERAYQAAQSEFINSAASLAAKYGGYNGAMIALSLYGINYFNKVQGEDNVRYYFITDWENAQLFMSGAVFYQYKQGNVINDASQMKSPLKGKVCLGLSNDNIADPINVLIKVTATIVKENWAMRSVQKINVKIRKEPYLKS